MQNEGNAKKTHHQETSSPRSNYSKRERELEEGKEWMNTDPLMEQNISREQSSVRDSEGFEGCRLPMTETWTAYSQNTLVWQVSELTVFDWHLHLSLASRHSILFCLPHLHRLLDARFEGNIAIIGLRGRWWMTHGGYVCGVSVWTSRVKVVTLCTAGAVDVAGTLCLRAACGTGTAILKEWDDRTWKSKVCCNNTEIELEVRPECCNTVRPYVPKVKTVRLGKMTQGMPWKAMQWMLTGKVGRLQSKRCSASNTKTSSP